MSFVKIPTDYFKGKKLRKYQELSGDLAGGMPIRTLCVAAEERSPDGRLPALPTKALEALIGWTGRDGLLLEAMLEAELIEKDEKGYRIVGWEAEQGHILKFHERAKKAAKALWRTPTVEATSIA